MKFNLVALFLSVLTLGSAAQAQAKELCDDSVANHIPKNTVIKFMKEIKLDATYEMNGRHKLGVFAHNEWTCKVFMHGNFGTNVVPSGKKAKIHSIEAFKDSAVMIMHDSEIRAVSCSRGNTKAASEAKFTVEDLTDALFGFVKMNLKYGQCADQQTATLYTGEELSNGEYVM